MPLLVLIASIVQGCAGSQPLQKPQQPIPYPSPPEAARYYYERSIYSTADVEKGSDEDRLRALLTGSTGKRGIAFAKPFDVAVHDNRVFVTDTVMQAIVALDLNEQRSFVFGNKGDEGDVGKPLGIAVDRKGTVYVVDNRLKRIAVYDRDGNYLYAMGGSQVMDRPAGIDVDPAGTRAYVVDVGGVGSDNHKIHVFDITQRRFLRDIASRGREPGQLNLPRDVKLGPDGLLYVSDGGNFRVQVFTTDGRFLRSWGKAGMRFGQFSRPKGISVDSSGNVFVVDAAFGNFQIFDSEGDLLLFIGNRSEQDGGGVFMLPAGIDIDANNRMYVVDQFFKKLEIFRPARPGELANE